MLSCNGTQKSRHLFSAKCTPDNLSAAGLALAARSFAYNIGLAAIRRCINLQIGPVRSEMRASGQLHCRPDSFSPSLSSAPYFRPNSSSGAVIFIIKGDPCTLR